MSTKGVRDFRPQIHFTPKTGWINDPNGLVFADGRYHLFAQYYQEPVWGPMHWYHAASKDLLHWEHLPVALEPDGLGYIFSGSAVYDEGNTSGFGQDGKAPIVAMYTSHGSADSTAAAPEQEQQSLAYSLDGVHFVKYQGNPVIPNSALKDFRDPKVFYNPVKKCWGMVLAAGDHVEFFASPDLKAWEKTGVFGPDGNFAPGVWECPDLFPLDAPGGGTKWVLLVSMGAKEAHRGARTQYFLGDFDGDRFLCDGGFTQAEFIDSGFDNYAGVTFSGTKDRILIGWAANWVYANQLPTGEFCCQYTLPRRLSLAETPAGVRLASLPVDNGVFGEPAPCGGTLPGEVFKLSVSGQGAAEIALSNPAGEVFRFGVNQENQVFVDRSMAGAKDFSESFATPLFSACGEPRFFTGKWTMDLIFDRSVCELFIDGGTRAFTQVLYPSIPFTRVSAGKNVVVTVGEAR